MKHLLLVFLVACLPSTSLQAAPPATSETISIARDISTAGRLRLQSQRLAKLYLQSGLGLNAEASRKQLKDGSTQFDADLATLSPYARNSRTRHSLVRSDQLWTDLRSALVAPYGAENSRRMNDLSNELMIAVGKLVMQIGEEAPTPVGRLLDLALRESMLAQRLAKLYLMALAGDQSYGRLVDIDQTRKEFASALNELLVASENSAASRDALALVKLQWIFFENEIHEFRRGERRLDARPEHVTSTSERIMETLALVSMQYAQDASPSRQNSDPHLTAAAGTPRH